MDFRDALNTAIGELTSQPWEYTTEDGVTLTVIPAGLREAPGWAEVNVRITADKTLAAEAGVTTTDLPGFIDALTARTAWRHVTAIDDEITAIPGEGGMVVTVTEVHWEDDGRCEVPASVRLPESQRLPLASALRRALDVARGWEDPA